MIDKKINNQPLSLLAILQELKTFSKAPDYVHIYCRKLHIESVDEAAHRPLHWLRIFACSITITAKAGAELTRIDLP